MCVLRVPHGKKPGRILVQRVIATLTRRLSSTKQQLTELQVDLKDKSKDGRTANGLPTPLRMFPPSIPQIEGPRSDWDIWETPLDILCLNAGLVGSALSWRLGDGEDHTRSAGLYRPGQVPGGRDRSRHRGLAPLLLQVGGLHWALGLLDPVFL